MCLTHMRITLFFLELPAFLQRREIYLKVTVIIIKHFIACNVNSNPPMSIDISIVVGFFFYY